MIDGLPNDLALSRDVSTSQIDRTRGSVTPDAQGTPIQDVRVDHRRAHIRMAEQFLHGLDVVSVLEQMRRKGWRKLQRRVSRLVAFAPPSASAASQSRRQQAPTRGTIAAHSP
jgi:hypothetical protein